MTPEAHKFAAEAGPFCFVTTESGEQQDVYNLTAVPCVQRSLCLDDLTNDSSSAPAELPKGVDSQTRDMLERCMATCEKSVGARPRGDPGHEMKHHLRKYEDTTSNLLKPNVLSGNPGLTMSFLTSLI